MRIKPLGFHVFIKAEEKLKQVGSIILPDTTEMQQRVGEVVAVGVGVYRGDTFVPTEVKPGDKVVFGMYSGQKLKFLVKDGDGTKEEIYHHMREDEIYCILEDGEDVISIEDVLE